MTDLSTTTREIARQAAREAVARRYDAAEWALRVAKIRSGEADAELFIQGALLGALAAVEAVRPLIRAEVVRECAAVARGYEAENDFSIEFRGTCRYAADAIERAILALMEKDTPA